MVAAADRLTTVACFRPHPWPTRANFVEFALPTNQNSTKVGEEPASADSGRLVLAVLTSLALDAATLVAARLAGVEHVYRAGGPLAVAAAAFGTETIPRCRKLEGPGSPWFAAARRLLAHRIASRLPAGPSETIVLADETADPAIAGLDIIIESEHGPDSSAFLVTWSREVAEGAMAAIPGY